VALLQTDVKRLLAYSSIAQAGYILVGLLAGSFEGYSSAFFYAFAYILMNAGAFLVTLMVAKSIGHDNPQISHFDGLAERAPFLSLLLLLSLLSLAGIPPLVGFTGKWILFSAAMDKGHWFLVLWGVLNSVVSLFYYLTLVKHAYLEKPKIGTPMAVPLYIKTLGLALFCAIILLGVFPNLFITFAQEAVASTILRS
jgi:NADH-quinone oxidoreductase subunit N